MFECLIDNLDNGKWKEVTVDKKVKSNFKQYHVLRNHTQCSDTEMKYLIAEEDGDPKSVVIKDCQCKKDPLKSIGNVELQLNTEETEIIGIDINDEIVLKE